MTFFNSLRAFSAILACLGLTLLAACTSAPAPTEATSVDLVQPTALTPGTTTVGLTEPFTIYGGREIPRYNGRAREGRGSVTIYGSKATYYERGEAFPGKVIRRGRDLLIDLGDNFTYGGNRYSEFLITIYNVRPDGSCDKTRTQGRRPLRQPFDNTGFCIPHS